MHVLRKNIVRGLVCTLAVAALAITGCNTVKGFGKDLEDAGEAIQDE